MNILIGIIVGITIVVLIILGIEFLSQLYETIKECYRAVEKVEEEKKLYCPHCNTNDTSQITKMIIMMQLPGRVIGCACFYCSNCSNRWFMELNTLKQKDRMNGYLYDNTI